MEKFIRTCGAQHQNWKHQLPCFLRQYRATPHSTTNLSPFEVLTGRKMRTSLPEIVDHDESYLSPTIAANDCYSKTIQKQYADQNRNAQQHTLKPGDKVLVRQHKYNKLSTPFDPNPFVVTDTNDSMITAERGSMVK